MALQEEFKTQGDFLFKYRSNLPLVVLVLGITIFIYQVYSKQLYFTGVEQNWYNLVCLAVCFLGLLIRIVTVGYTPKNTSGRNTAVGQLADELNTKGIYSTVRHPLYVGNFFMWFGISLLTQEIWFNVAFVLAYWIYYERIMYAEESFLRGKFGDAYLKWSENVPAFILSFKNYKKTELQFSVKKVLKSEKNGFVAIFVLFYAFIVVQSFIEQGKFTFVIDFWSVATIASMVIYLILKFLKHKTKVLEQEGR